MRKAVLYSMFVLLAALVFALPAAAQTTLINENFDGVTAPALPAGWAVAHPVGTSTNTGWTTKANPLDFPTAAPHSLQNAAKFNSFSISTPNEYRLYRTVGANLGCNPGTVTLTFWMYHDSGYSGSTDRIQIQYSTDGGTNWTNVAGALYNRYAATNAWTQHTVDLTALGAGQTNFHIAFYAITAYGNNMYIDDVLLTASNTFSLLAYASHTMADHCVTGGAGDMDGVADPGESLDLTVNLANTGTAAGTGYSATLSTTTPNVTIPTNTATWPSIPAGSTGTAANAPFVVDVGTAVPCGTLMQFSLTITNGTCTFTSAFTIRVGAAQAPVTVQSQNWDALTPPALGTWASAVVGTPTGTTPPAWTSAAGRTHPSGTAFSAPNDVRFNSYDTSSGNQARLYQTAAMNLGAYPTVSLNFQMYHDTVFSAGDNIQVQYSTNGSTWTNVPGAVFLRNDGSTGWKLQTVDLSAYGGGQASFYIAFLATSAYGNDIYLDDIAVTGTPYLCHTCSACVINSCDANGPAVGFAGFPVNFTGSETHLGCTGTATWSWTFTDGGTSTDQNPVHTFAVPGLYGYTMTVTIDGVSCTDEYGWIQICELACSASADPTSGYAPLTVYFAANAVITNCEAPNKQVITYTWDFGDGTGSTAQNPTHVYTTHGAFTWTCTIDVDGTQCVRTGTVNVRAFDMHFLDDYNTTWLCVDSDTGFWVLAVFSGAYPGIYTGKGNITYYSDGTMRLTGGGRYPQLKLWYKAAMSQAHAELWMNETIRGAQLKDMNTLDDPPECPPLGPGPEMR